MSKTEKDAPQLFVVRSVVLQHSSSLAGRNEVSLKVIYEMCAVS